MKILTVLGTIFKKIPKLDPIVNAVAETSRARTIIKSSIRILQIITATYLLYKGLIDSEDAIDIINGK